MKELPRLALTMGDPSGIGPEIIVKALSEKKVYAECIPVVVADGAVLKHAINMVASPLKLKRLEDPLEAVGAYGTIEYLELNNVDMDTLVFGKVLASSGKAAFESIDKAIDLSLEKKVAGVITTPINKDSINRAGFHYSGHTEIFAEKTKTKHYAMMLIHDPLRVVHVSTHVSLRKACDLVKKDRVLEVIRLAHGALVQLGFDEPNIAVAGLNPHAGENGMFGDEEMKEIIPAIKQAGAEGLNVSGPLPPDTVFSKALAGQYDVVVVMYHDQGHIPLKLTGFKYDNNTGKWDAVSGVNITLGLPIVRSSVDHGTAFGKAGKGTANPQSMIEAIHYGALLATKGK
ncbi:4-hydroxythreonine-4-phosphate dehydrogenase PdxA [Sediminispirochaeta bajacaliforniensis]|uniref:4-hydroxythreonine-4-phosphate dehydrogenase PdxA n=1 Tax=Sediminispirochaeta bajacaliforniensis TaxID=148 RepID=UPI00036EA7C2|nr:4-hydroxythreonine-4-phosphate dehydrogenase PdxA [Sediminispirochaeta bajacaliforniensis]